MSASFLRPFSLSILLSALALRPQGAPPLARAEAAWQRYTALSNTAQLCDYLARESDAAAQRHLVRLVRSNLGAATPVDALARSLAQAGQQGILLDTLFAPRADGSLPFDRRAYLPFYFDALATRGEWEALERELLEEFSRPEAPAEAALDALERVGRRKQAARLDGLLAERAKLARTNLAACENISMARAWLSWSAEDLRQMAARLSELRPVGEAPPDSLRFRLAGDLELMLTDLYRGGRDRDFRDLVRRFGQYGFTENLADLDRKARRRLGEPLPSDPREPLETLFLEGAFPRIASEIRASTKPLYLMGLLAAGQVDAVRKKSARLEDRAFWEFAARCFAHESDAVARALAAPDFGVGDERLLAIRAALKPALADARSVPFFIAFQKLAWSWNTNAETYFLKERAHLAPSLSDFAILETLGMWMHRDDAAAVDRWAAACDPLLASASARESLQYLWGRHLYGRDRARCKQVLSLLLLNRPQTVYRWEIVRLLRD
ncbi:MAG: hypothetical protein J0L75_02375 [Spirochaetes bacterium]|nr:hypothetical protein [Spirochaetota bacterium]